MSQFTPITLNNTGSEVLFQDEPFVRLAPHSKILDSEIEGGLMLHEYACINRSRIGKYHSIGLFSYLADAVVGRYCSFASRISVGAFSHPTEWLSVHEFQYRDTSQICGETIVEKNHNALQKGEKATHIGSDVWIGDNAAVVRGVNIGHGAIIGMSSVVVNDVEPYCIVVGNPARVVRKRFSDQAIEKLLALEWWNLDISEMKGIEFSEVDRAIEQLQQRMNQRKKQ